MKYIIYALLFTVLVVAIAASTQAFDFGLGEIKAEVEKVITKEVQKIEAKIDGFVVAEVRKVEKRMIKWFGVFLGIQIFFNTVTILAVRKFLTK